MARHCHSSMYNSLIEMGMDDRWSRYRGGGYTEAHQVGPYKVEIADEGVDTRILLWNPLKPCVSMVIEKQSKEAVFDLVEYDADCATPQMTRGSGTRDMIHFGLDLLKQQGAIKVQLTDKSRVRCGTSKVRLGLMYFLKYGQTWYEKYFGFYPSPEYIDQYEKLKNRRLELDIDFIAKQPCEYFTDDVLQDILSRIGYKFLQSIIWEKEL